MRFSFLFLFLASCCQTSECLMERYGLGGGQDVVSVNLPFDLDFVSTCVQGVGGDFSHSGDNTYYDVDLDTPNDEDVIVYAPVDGVAYVHDTDRNRNYGVHVNIDLGDNTYVVLGHLEDVFIDNGSEVAAGQIIGFEGTTGASTGDHMHIGRHRGDASEDAIYGDSVEGMSFVTADDADLLTSDMSCSLSSGGRYESVLATPRWRPSGSLVMTPYASTVYYLDSFTLRPFANESAFITRNFDFSDVALMSEEEMACYAVGEAVSDSSELRAVNDEGSVWLLVGTETSSSRYRAMVPSYGWQGVLKTWGFSAATYDDLDVATDDLLTRYPVVSGTVNYRDGSLVSTTEDSAVYVMADDAALPIDRWETLLVLGWEDRDIVEVAADEFDRVATVRGNCTTGSYCLDGSDVVTCGGPHEDGGTTYPDESGIDTGAPVDTGATEADNNTSEEDAGGDSAPLTLSLVWQTPSSVRADRISLSGEFTDGEGMSYGWSSNIATSTNSDMVAFDLSAYPGDSFRFSVEYVIGGVTSWSCLAPYPPGTTVGTAAAMYNGASLNVRAADDPGSEGCGLVVDIPN